MQSVKAAGGSADIHAYAAGQGDGKALHGFLQLQTASAPHISMDFLLPLSLPPHQNRGRPYPPALSGNKHIAGHDDGLRLFPGGAPALFYQKHINRSFISSPLTLHESFLIWIHLSIPISCFKAPHLPCSTYSSGMAMEGRAP